MTNGYDGSMRATASPQWHMINPSERGDTMTIDPTSVAPTTQLAPPVPTISGDLTLVPEPASELPVPPRARIRHASSRAVRILLVVLSLWIFLAAISVMKDGAAALAPSLKGSAFTDSPASALGFGWLGAMVVMSGSPIAVSALTLHDGGVVTVQQALTMLTGSRLGASFVVLVVAFAYAMRGKLDRKIRHASLSIGIFSLLLTAVVYVPALAIGLPLLGSESFRAINIAAPPEMLNFVKAATAPLVDAVEAVTPTSILFLAGLALLLVSLRLLDAALPDAAETAHLEEHRNWRNRKWVMFGLGSLVALVTMSVSVALTVLVPAVSKGYFRRRQVLPYIMGANITTLGDTLVSAYVIGNPAGVHVVLAELMSITLVTGVLLAFLYTPLTQQVVRITDTILNRKSLLVSFVTLLFTLPLMLVWAL
jgi:sodium-dependent phosphate cotransporter